MNIGRKVDAFLTEIEQAGFEFNDDRLNCHVFRECIWHQEYAVFVINILSPLIDNRQDFYEESWSDHEMYSEFDATLKRKFPQATVFWHKGSNEFEVVGPRNDEFYSTFEEEIESFPCSEWKLFEERLV